MKKVSFIFAIALILKLLSGCHALQDELNSAPLAIDQTVQFDSNAE